MTEYNAAIDLSCDEAAFAVSNGKGKILIEDFLKVKRRDSSGLLPWIEKNLKKNDIGFENIRTWYTGTGPGSFTGLRLVASIIAGLTFKKETEKKGIPTALAIAAASSEGKPGKNAVVFDGRNKELLIYGTEISGNSISADGNIFVLGKGHGLEKALNSYDSFSALEKDREAIEKIIPERFIPQIIYIEKVPVKEFLSGKISLKTPINELVYIRPAVFVTPRKIRKIL
jgi:tRNA A37 threonylcarbamoyladenosine modification protein TsaB